jgi:dTMP kinase
MYIAIEGIDGSGTTTVSKQLVDKLQARQMGEVEWAHEPSDLVVGQLIRRLLRSGYEFSIKGMLYLFMADRIDHMERKVIPLREKGVTVISDRCFVSTLCYQEIHHSAKYLQALHRQILFPDLVIVLDVELEEAIRRRSGRDTTELYEKADIQKRVWKNYKQGLPYWCEEMPFKLEYVDANRELPIVVETCLQKVDQFRARL